MAERTMVEALNLALDEALGSDPAVCLMGQDIGVNGGVFRVTRGLQERYGEDRVMDTPLVECGIIGTGRFRPQDRDLGRQAAAGDRDATEQAAASDRSDNGVQPGHLL